MATAAATATRRTLTSVLDNMAEAQLDLAWALKGLHARQVEYQLYTDYYHGRHRMAFATDKFQTTFGRLFRQFYLNLCGRVVDALDERLTVRAFQSFGGDDNDAAWQLWEDNDLELHASEIHSEALTAGDAYLLVWPDQDTGQPCFYPHAAHACTVDYDPERPGYITRAAKWWLDELGRCHINVYTPERIVKWMTPRKSFGLPDSPKTFVLVPEDDDVMNPVPNEWGVVPIFHFANSSRTGTLGESELANVVPLQDALNKSIIDMLVAMESQALPQRWVTGLELDVDETTGQPVSPFKPAPGSLWVAGDTEVTFGQFDPANLGQFLDVQEKFQLAVARITGTPLHYLLLGGGQFPSGEAMITAEAPFIAKIEKRQQRFGVSWRKAMTLALRMAHAAQTQGVRPVWTPAAPKSEQLFYQNLIYKQQMGVSQLQLWREMGYDSDTIKLMQQENSDSQTAAMQAQMDAFNRGDVPGSLGMTHDQQPPTTGQQPPAGNLNHPAMVAQRAAAASGASNTLA